MTLLYIGTVIFVGVHLLGMFLPGARDRLKARLGENPYKGLYSLVSAVGLVVMIYGFYTANQALEPDDYVYTPAPWTRHAAMGLVLLAFIFLGASHGKGYLKLWLQQPMSIGIGLWAFAHVLANGERPAIVFFGAFLVLAVLDIILSTVRGKVPHHEPQLKSDARAAVIGVIVYLIFLFGFHPYILHLPIVT
jgi:uncharacterized membrane protein